MNKTIITLVSIMVIIVAIFTAIAIFNPKQVEEKENIGIQVAEEEILDECTEEHEQMESENTVKANMQEEKTSPNCSLITKTYFSQCGHTKEEYANLPQDFVNLGSSELKEKYPDYEIEAFANNEVVLYQEKQGECGEHYMVKDKEGEVVIYQILQDGTQKELEVTAITTEYLPEADKINMKNGIQVNGKQALNQLLEDYE